MVVSSNQRGTTCGLKTTRPQYERRALRYSSDVTDAEWLVILPHLPQRKRFGYPAENRAAKHRRCVALHGQDRLSVAIAATRFFRCLRPCRTISTPGATTAFCSGSTSNCWWKPAKSRVAKPVPRPGSSTVSPSRPPRAAARAGMTPAKRSRGQAPYRHRYEWHSWSAPRSTRSKIQDRDGAPIIVEAIHDLFPWAAPPLIVPIPGQTGQSSHPIRPLDHRDRQTRRSRLRRASPSLGGRTYPRLAQSQPPPGQRLRGFDRQCQGLALHRWHPTPHQEIGAWLTQPTTLRF